MSLNALTILAAESHDAPTIHPYLVGGIALVILLGLLLALVAFGGGREHS
ncbi:hypothetical protein [Nocardioides sp. Soil805]|nr:hypothetical protein [Nocardioides sp. Soil805]